MNFLILECFPVTEPDNTKDIGCRIRGRIGDKSRAFSLGDQVMISSELYLSASENGTRNLFRLDLEQGRVWADILRLVGEAE